MLYQGFKTFSEKSPLLENIQMAKDYLLKRYATAKNIKTSEIPEEVKQRIFNDPKFMEVRELTQKFPNYAPLFTKFAFDQKATKEELEEIVDLLIKYKNNLAKDLDMPVLDYGKIEPTKDDIRPGYEVLGDALRNIPRKVKLRKFYSQLTIRMRREFEKATEEQIAKLEEISNQLDRLEPRPGKDPDTGAEVTQHAWTEFTKTLKGYDDIRTYPNYANPKVAFESLIENADLFISQWDQSDDELVEKLKSMGAQVGFLYNKNGYIVLSTRTPDALRAVAGDTNWCIRNDSTFWSYGGGKVQLVIINRNLPASEPKSLYGITVNADQSVYTDAVGRSQQRVTGKNGSGFNNKPLSALLDSQDFPNELIGKTLKEFPMEVDIKLALEEFFRNQGSLTPQKIIISLLNINKGFLAGKIEEGEWERISGIVAVILKDTQNLKPAAFLKLFKENGIMSESGWNVFKKVVGDDFTPDDIKEIYNKTVEGLETMEYVLELSSKGQMKLKAEEVETMKKCVDNKDQILERIKSKM
jgi:hypothetical protein